MLGPMANLELRFLLKEEGNTVIPTLSEQPGAH